jgi:hypothetical protein
MKTLAERRYAENCELPPYENGNTWYTVVMRLHIGCCCLIIAAAWGHFRLPALVYT